MFSMNFVVNLAMSVTLLHLWVTKLAVYACYPMSTTMPDKWQQSKCLWDKLEGKCREVSGGVTLAIIINPQFIDHDRLLLLHSRPPTLMAAAGKANGGELRAKGVNPPPQQRAAIGKAKTKGGTSR